MLTGFLGSGKTTLLSRLLRAPNMRATAVLINEFGQIGLDHLLVRAVHGNTVVLQNGCICCSIQEDLQHALRDLVDGKLAGPVAHIERVVIETTGLANPVPIVGTLLHDPMLCNQIRLANIIATVDGLLGYDQVDRYSELLRQVAIADRIVITKTDIAPLSAVERLCDRLATMNPTAQFFDAQSPKLDPAALLEEGVWDQQTRLKEVGYWLVAKTDVNDSLEPNQYRHDHGQSAGSVTNVQTFSLRIEGAVDWSAFGIWLTSLLHRHGPRVLRIKGLLNVADAPGPVVLHGVQHVIHPPTHLPVWPDEDRASRLVFIVADINAEVVRRSLFAFLKAAAGLDH